MSLLTPPQVSLRSLIANLVDGGDVRFPNKLLHDFLDIFNHFSGFNTTCEATYVETFQEVDWSPLSDPEYKVVLVLFRVCLSIVIISCPLTTLNRLQILQLLMLNLFEDLIDDLPKKLGAEKTKTPKEIEDVKMRKRKLIENFANRSVALKKKASREGRLGRDIAKRPVLIRGIDITRDFHQNTRNYKGVQELSTTSRVKSNRNN
ncbi:unnamed protein product [Eruca vesicaria subsp. sativa]|uniref:Uncharacterized protein n=1 Tax=Eruca vesicaria subsp. sativa TaxID=29727 RepID=A0ABC8KPQ6_ERUVS|nr:unnamed protein product [Eruca vesicaria subsp. sativa]